MEYGVICKRHKHQTSKEEQVQGKDRKSVVSGKAKGHPEQQTLTTEGQFVKDRHFYPKAQ